MSANLLKRALNVLRRGMLIRHEGFSPELLLSGDTASPHWWTESRPAPTDSLSDKHRLAEVGGGGEGRGGAVNGGMIR